MRFILLRKLLISAHCNDPEIAKLNDVDTVFTTMKFPSGVLMHIESQRECAYGYDQTIEVYRSLKIALAA